MSSEAGLGFVDGLVQLSFQVQSVIAQTAARHDLTVPQVRLLGILRDREPGMLQLARHLGLDKSSWSGAPQPWQTAALSAFAPLRWADNTPNRSAQKSSSAYKLSAMRSKPQTNGRSPGSSVGYSPGSGPKRTNRGRPAEPGPLAV